MPILAVFRRGSLERLQPLQGTILAIRGGVARSIIGVGRLNDVVALSNSQHDVATMGVQRVADEARRVGIERVGDRLAEFVSEKFGDLVFEALAGLVGERKIARVRAGPEDVRVDQLDRAFRILRASAARKRDSDQRENCDARSTLSRSPLPHSPMHFVSAVCELGRLAVHVCRAVRAGSRPESARADRRKCR